jgi:hypothetical protein
VAGKAEHGSFEVDTVPLQGAQRLHRRGAVRGAPRLHPFKPGKRIAVKVIDDRGNEVVKVVDAAR